jgi:integration host factor subunit alpha
MSASSTSSDLESLGTITRAHLADAVHQAVGLSRAEAAKYVEMVLTEIFESLVAREDVKLSSFGAFCVRAKKERVGRNPKTGVGAPITARLVVVFKASNVLRARINGDAPQKDGNGKLD